MASAQDRLATQLRHYALGLLARREHSAWELARKLRARYPEATALLPDLLEQLATDGQQSDQRFCESYIRSRCHAGYGPQVIAQQLIGKGINREQATLALSSHDEQWQPLAYQVKCKKFGIEPARQLADKARQLRFLRYRGFSQQQAQSAICQSANL